MLGKLIRFIKRPLINEQNTGREAFQQYNGYAYAGVNGNGGQGVRRSMRATSPATIAIGPTHKLNDPTATGNNNTNLQLQPLSKDNISIVTESIASF